MVKQSTAVSSGTITKKPRAPRKKKILVDVETVALKGPAVFTPIESSYEMVTRVPENDSLETREPPKLSATFTPQVSESQPIMPVVNVQAGEIAPGVFVQANKFVVQNAIDSMATPPILPLRVDLNSRKLADVYPGLTDANFVMPDGSAYTLVNVTKGPDDFLYVGEAERVAREEAEAASKDGYFTPTRAVTKRFDFLPRERKKIILALVAGIFCLLGLIALATLAFFGEIGIFS